MKPARQDRVSLRLTPPADSLPAVESVLDTFKREHLGFQAAAAQANSLTMNWKTEGYLIEAKLETDAEDPRLVRAVTLTALVDQNDLEAAANALNESKCKLSQGHSMTISGDEPPYFCDSCSKAGGCEYCKRLVARLGKRRAATEAARGALAWINSYPERRAEFIAALPEVQD